MAKKATNGRKPNCEYCGQTCHNYRPYAGRLNTPACSEKCRAKLYCKICRAAIRRSDNGTCKDCRKLFKHMSEIHNTGRQHNVKPAGRVAELAAKAKRGEPLF